MTKVVLNTADSQNPVRMSEDRSSFEESSRRAWIPTESRSTLSEMLWNLSHAHDVSGILRGKVNPDLAAEIHVGMDPLLGHLFSIESPDDTSPGASMGHGVSASGSRYGGRTAGASAPSTDAPDGIDGPDMGLLPRTRHFERNHGTQSVGATQFNSLSAPLPAAAPLDDRAGGQEAVSDEAANEGSTNARFVAQNPANALDVNNDQVVNPLDALLVIGALNSVEDQKTTSTISSVATQPVYYFDVNRDSVISPLDALLVIDGLNSATVEPMNPSAADVGTMSCGFSQGLEGWETTESGGSPAGHGGATIDGAAAVLREGDSFIVALSRTFDIPDGATTFSFRFTDLNFDTTDTAFINDAFEAAIVDENGDPLVHTIADNRDAIFNISEDQPPATGTGTTFDGSRVTVDISHLFGGTTARIVLRLINNDGDKQTPDQNTTVRIVDVQCPHQQVTLSPVAAKDDGDWGYRERGAWQDGTDSDGWQGDHRVLASESVDGKATWVTRVQPGNYEIFATWPADPQNAVSATYRVLDGNNSAGTITHDQRMSPDDGEFDGATWKSLGVFNVTTGVPTIELTNPADGNLVADGIIFVPVVAASVPRAAISSHVTPANTEPGLQLDILSPAVGETFAAGATVLVSGNANAPVIVNGIPVDTIDASGNFFTQVFVAPGANTFEFTAVDAFGQSASATLTLVGEQSSAGQINFDLLSDTSASFEQEYYRTSFDETSNVLYADLAVRNAGTYLADAPLLVGIRNISDPSVRVRGAIGVTTDGLPYFEMTDANGDRTLDQAEITESATLAFYNPNRIQFDFDLVFFGQLNRAPAITSVPDIEAPLANLTHTMRTPMTRTEIC